MLKEPRASGGELGPDQLPGCLHVAQYEQHGQSCSVPLKEGLLDSLGTILGPGMWGGWSCVTCLELQGGYELPEGQRVTSS